MGLDNFFMAEKQIADGNLHFTLQSSTEVLSKLKLSIQKCTNDNGQTCTNDDGHTCANRDGESSIVYVYEVEGETAVHYVCRPALKLKCKRKMTLI